MSEMIKTYGLEQDPETMENDTEIQADTGPGDPLPGEDELVAQPGDSAEEGVETPPGDTEQEISAPDGGDSADAAEKKPTKPRQRKTARAKAKAETTAEEEPAERAEEESEKDSVADSGNGADDGPDTLPDEDVPVEEKPKMTRAERDRLNAERRRERMRIQRQNAALDESGRPIMDGDGTFEESIAEIYRVRNAREIVSGFIDEVKQGRGNSEDYIESMYNGFRVLIPFSEMDVDVEHREDETEQDYRNRKFTTISNMLGAEIDYVIRDVSIEDRLAGGSRLQATRERRRSILNNTNRDGSYVIFVGRQCTARVLATHPTFAFLEVYGMRVRLRARDIRSEYVSDVTRELQVGDSVKVYVTHLERDKSGNVTEMFVSMRNDEAERRDLERAAADLHVGDTCRGRVSSRSRKAIFIRLNNGVHAFCHVANGLQGRSIPNVGDTVAVRIVRKMTNNSSGNPLMQGKIVRNLKFIAK